MPAELTARALLVGCGIGAVLAAANVYTGLKISVIDGGSITATLLGFTLFATFSRLSRRSAYSAVENNITQTTASSAAIMGFAAGLGGPVPGMALAGQSFPAWAITIWGASLAVIGILAGALLRRKLIVEDGLPFPTGSATGNLIETMFAARAAAIRRTRLLVGGALFAVAVTWFRDGRPKLIPEMTLFGLTVGGVSLNAVSFGMNWSPMVGAMGVMMGLRAALSMLIGATIGWGMLVPWLARNHIVKEVSFSGCTAWLVWPGLGLLLAGSFLPLLLDGRSIMRAFRDLGGLAQAQRTHDRGNAPSARRVGLGLVLAAVAGVALVGQEVFHFHPLATLAALALALVLAVVSSRATGETDLAPVGPVGTITQILFSRFGISGSMLAGSIAFGTSAQAAQTLWAFKAGQKVNATPRAQLIAQLTGALLGALVVAPVYMVVVRAYGIGSEALPAPSAISWKATAEAMRGGLATLPLHAGMAGAIGLGVGALLALLGRGRLARFCPSPAAMGIALIMPPSLAVAALAGVIVMRVAQRLRPSLDQDGVMAIAAGGLAGESMMGVVIAVLVLLGVVR
ncbi:MAG TPA: OPT family oligopeptide transporter [Polyangia bacterium]|nr:OPT family oligopeptide transporter [Polyangia bacterium]